MRRNHVWAPLTGGGCTPALPFYKALQRVIRRTYSNGWSARTVQLYVAMERQTLKKAQKIDKSHPRPFILYFFNGFYDSERRKTPNRKQYDHVTYSAMAPVDRAQATLWAKVVSDCLYLAPIQRYGRQKCDYVIAKKLQLQIFLTSDKMAFSRAWGPLSRCQTATEQVC